MTRRIDIVEVGPRDGLQNDPGNLSTDQKLEFISRLEDSGVKRMESGSFVSPRGLQFLVFFHQYLHKGFSSFLQDENHLLVLWV